MMSASARKRILILGGGFGGLYVAMHLDKMLAKTSDVDITLVNKDNFFLFTPLLHEVAAGEVDTTHIVNPIRKLLKHVSLFNADVQDIDLVNRSITVLHGSDYHRHVMPYDHLVLGLGSITNFYDLPGLEKHALTMKSLGDAITMRNRVIAHLEEADTECAVGIREPLLTFVVAGGGFAGVETVAALHDFAVEALRCYPNLSRKMLRVVLVHSESVVLPELGEKLGRYAQEQLAARGVELKLNARVSGADTDVVYLNNGEAIPTRNLIWTAGVAGNPLLHDLPCPLERGRVKVSAQMAVENWPGVWALGDCACLLDEQTGKPYPPTAQHAIRQAKVVAQNITSDLRGKPRCTFRFKGLGALASLGRRTGVANILGINFSGFVAWWLWRTIYLSKLPRLEKKVRVALDWTLDLLFDRDLVQFLPSNTTANNIMETMATGQSQPVSRH
jgi:NADH dehydrogenase